MQRVMIGFIAVLMCAGIFGRPIPAYAGTSYVITNDDNCYVPSNTSTVYALDTSTGYLRLVETLYTGGTGHCGGLLSAIGTTVSRDAECIFLFDYGSSDIAAFAIPTLTKVGNYSDPALIFSRGGGGSMSMTPNGKFLYATYDASRNIGAWRRNADCSLTFIAAYTATSSEAKVTSVYPDLLVEPHGRGLIVSLPALGGLELFGINPDTGMLTDLGFADLTSLDCFNIDGCFPNGIDITRKGLAVIGNGTFGSSAFTAQISVTKPYFKDLTYVDLKNSANLVGDLFPWLSAAAYATGNGSLYFGFTGLQYPSGVLQTSLSVSGITPGMPTRINSYTGINGMIQTTGNWLVLSEWFNQLQVFRINGDGSLTATDQGPVTDENADGALTFFIYPPTR